MANHTKQPYLLPEPLLCEAQLVEDGVSLELAKKYIKKHEGRTQRYIYLDAMYKGFHDSFKLPEKEGWKPDNRLAVNFPRYLVDTFMGYAYGKRPVISTDEDDLQKRIDAWYDTNDAQDYLYELFKKTVIFGHSFEYIYQDEEAQTRNAICTPIELFCVYDDTMRRRCLFAVRYGYHYKETGKGDIYGEIMTRETIKRFDGDRITEEIENPYGYIPVVEHIFNEERMSIFESITGMTEIYNNALGEKANDVDAFAEAYLEILGMPVDEEGVHRIHDDRIINVFGTDDAKDVIVQFLQKPTADATQENLLDRIEKLVFMISMVANISDDTFGNAASGVSLGYKLWSTSNLANTFDSKNRKSIRKFFKIFCSLSNNYPREDAWKEIDVTFNRNVPEDKKSEVEIASSLEGIVSKKTQLEQLSFVPDADEEIKQMEEESETTMQAGAQLEYTSPAQFRNALREYAEQHGLTYEEVLEELGGTVNAETDTETV